jgi:hypothetical protein
LLIHLLRFRKQQVLRFPGVYRLISLLKETQSTRNLNYYLLLANRLLLFTTLVLAFAQPSCHSQSAEDNSQFSTVGVLWDVSPSMFETDAKGQIPIENAKKNGGMLTISLQIKDVNILEKLNIFIESFYLSIH